MTVLGLQWEDRNIIRLLIDSERAISEFALEGKFIIQERRCLTRPKAISIAKLLKDRMNLYNLKTRK